MDVTTRTAWPSDSTERRLSFFAPDLLAALQHIADFTAYQDCDNCLAMNAVAREAIAKIAGESA